MGYEIMGYICGVFLYVHRVRCISPRVLLHEPVDALAQCRTGPRLDLESQSE